MVPTLAPSMDICVSSNFERYLFHLSGDDGEVLAGWLKGFEATGLYLVTGSILALPFCPFCGVEEAINLLVRGWPLFSRGT